LPGKANASIVCAFGQENEALGMGKIGGKWRKLENIA